MSGKRIGIAVGRRELTLAGLEGEGRGQTLAVRARIARAPGTPLDASIKELLTKLDAGWRRCEIRIALSPGELACADLFETPFQSDGQVQAVAGSLAEGRAAGETAESLAVDALPLEHKPSGILVELSAISIAVLDAVRSAVREALPHGHLTLVSSTPAVLARAFAPQPGPHIVAFQAGDEGFILSGRGGELPAVRCFPLEDGHPLSPARLQAAANGLGASDVTIRVLGPAEEVALNCGIRVEPAYACAAALAALDPATLTDVLRGAPDAPKSIGSKFERPLMALAGAAALLLIATGLLFHVKGRRAEAALDRIAEQERKLGFECLPSQKIAPGSLVAALKRILEEQQRTAEANRGPSALKIWSELGRVMPDPDQTGFVLESLQFDPEGGRFTAKVDARAGDPLANATLLEHALNGSERLSARGEFETKGNAVTVRMRLDYRAPREAITQTRAEAAKP